MSDERGVLTKWSDNVLIARVGAACRVASEALPSDDIDRGLNLLNALREAGYVVEPIGAAPDAGERERTEGHDEEPEPAHDLPPAVLDVIAASGEDLG
ncbi:MAG: hypothetical protein OEW52_00300 [Thermoleophilia bacterium]|nr:hypothetical protein [Thermoleophilia bacterium]